MANGKGPVKKFSAGAIACSLWENEINVDGQAKTVLKATVERRYKDAAGQWKSSNSYSRNEIPLVIHVLEKAFECMLHEKDLNGDQAEEVVM
jgi:hypothetical protein